MALTVRGGLGAGGFKGDLAALGVMLVIAIMFVLLRKAGGRDMLPALALGGLFTAGIGLAFAPTLAVAGTDQLYLPLLVTHRRADLLHADRHRAALFAGTRGRPLDAARDDHRPLLGLARAGRDTVCGHPRLRRR